MPERQSTPGATTTKQDAEAAARGAAADNASSSPDEPTRPVSRGAAATVGLARAIVPTPPVESQAAPSPGHPAAPSFDSSAGYE